MYSLYLATLAIFLILLQSEKAHTNEQNTDLIFIFGYFIFITIIGWSIGVVQ
jgi:hypothetical protein